MLKFTQPEGSPCVIAQDSENLFLKLKSCELYFERVVIGVDVTLEDLQDVFDVVDTVPTWDLAIKQQQDLIAIVKAGVVEPEDDESLLWGPGQLLEPGNRRTYDGKTYVVRLGMEHISQVGQDPSQAHSLWELLPDDLSDGQYPDFIPCTPGIWDGYLLDSIVRFTDGLLYQVVQVNAGNKNTYAPNVWGWKPYAEVVKKAR
jgi:hypothetical protein